MTQEKYEKPSNIAANLISFILITILVVIVGIMIYAGIVVSVLPSSEVINKDDAPLAPGEVWILNDQFAIWIDSAEEVSAENAQSHYPEITDTEGKRYFDIVFSFQNIRFDGCYSEDTLKYDYLNVWTDARACDENGDTVYPAPLRGYDKRDFYTTWQDGVEIPVTPGLVSTDNHIIVEIGNASDEQIQPSYFAVRFVVPTEILSSEASVQYRQDYIIPIP